MLQKEEELRKEEERKKALDERLRFEQERMEQERQEQEERERRYREREQQIEEHRCAPPRPRGAGPWAPRGPILKACLHLSFQEETTDFRSRGGQEAVEGAVYLCKFLVGVPVSCPGKRGWSSCSCASCGGSKCLGDSAGHSGYRCMGMG